METKRKSIGAIDALAAGFDLVRRRPCLPALLLVLNLLLWLGPRISVAPLADRAAQYLLTSQSGSATLGQLAQTQADLIRQWGHGSNLLALLTSSILGMASVVSALIGGQTGVAGFISGLETKPSLAAPIVISDGWEALGTSAALVIVGLFLASVFLGMIAVSVRGGRLSFSDLAPRVLRSWARLLLLTLLVPVALIVLGIPLALLVGVITLISVQGALFVVSVGAWFLMMLAVWATIYLYFTIDAIILDDVPVTQAIWRSFNVVRRGFGATALLIVLIALLGAGMSVVWQVISGSTVGTIVAVVGSSIIGAGLAGASLSFYQQRRVEWSQALDELRARLQAQGPTPKPDSTARP